MCLQDRIIFFEAAIKKVLLCHGAEANGPNLESHRGSIIRFSIVSARLEFLRLPTILINTSVASRSLS